MPGVDDNLRRINARQKLRARSRAISLEDIAGATELTIHWLKLFHAGKHAKAHMRLVTRLENYFAERNA